MGHRYDSALWAPLQSGALAVCLQVQKNARFVSGAVYFIGEKLEPLWLPSQNGCLPDLPQTHHQ
jgi:hypothetical protein